MYPKKQWRQFFSVLLIYGLVQLFSVTAPVRAVLLTDGSFEECIWGDCLGCEWDCTGNPPNDWVINPEQFGISAYDGILAGWLGGFMGDEPIQTKLCNTVHHILASNIKWHWTAYINEGHEGNVIRATMNGDVVFEHTLSYPEDHTFGEWQQVSTINLDPWCGELDVEFCIEIIPTDGASYLVDYFWGQRWCDVVSTEDMSFSAVKSLYR